MLFANGRGDSPGAFNSAKANFPSGNKIRRSGIPAKEGATNFGAIPPAFFTAVVNFFSIVFSNILVLHQAVNLKRWQGVSMVFSILFLIDIFIGLRKVLYNTLIHLVIYGLNS